MQLKLKNESKLTGKQVDEGTLQRKQFIQRHRGTLKRPGAFRGHTPLCVAGAQGESQGMVGTDDEEPCLTMEECALFYQQWGGIGECQSVTVWKGVHTKKATSVAVQRAGGRGK